MANLLDYLLTQGHQMVADFPINDLDRACLNELAYLPYQEHLPADVDWSVPQFLSDLAGQVNEDDLSFNFLVTAERVALLKAILEAPRFSGLRLGHYVNQISQAYEYQFAAMVWEWPEANHRQLVFRGTDDSLIGWKEDFNMSYRRTIPAQQFALSYLSDYLRDKPYPLVVSGHSKGGNLALYATAFLPEQLQAYIQSVYVYDAPGLHQSVLESSGYQTMRERVVGFRPEESIVGVMLGSDLSYQTVASQGKGMGQHDMSNWQVAEGSFEFVEGLSALSRSLEKTFDEWLNSHSQEDLKLFFDTCFDLFFDAGIDSINDLSQDTSQALKQLLGTINQLDKRQRDFLLTTVGQLLASYRKHALETTWQDRTAAFSAFLEKWQSSEDNS